ncbi:LON peptidase substrate-binding domain-containing protein [Ferrimonas lipolytica]|uniref:ATP-dependent protease n=1 Tax=Ferrimonas lipolytica TaxID=2724191 RepID=A0A6H1U9E9_9GAMM|nr:LON peptidase substrate-binding domain-containing protein [Ferrimonas lipolytica]QIZ75675.1 ATP-dependent protease [Ferrimonas lipolytica]
MTEYQALPLFPLPSQVFPGGKMSLRIFEPRYLRMVKESYQSGNGFAICMLDERGNTDANSHILPLATRVEVIDFDQLDDGLLGITVVGLERIEVTNIRTEADGLRIGVVTTLPCWPKCQMRHQQQLVAEQLRRVYQDYQELAQLYPEPQFDDASWVAQRWLEIVPLAGSTKQQLWQFDEPTPTLNLIAEMLQKD